MSSVLSADEIHVWTVPLIVDPAELARLGGLLSDSERERAGRYLHVPAREQFTITRARLRLLVGRTAGGRGVLTRPVPTNRTPEIPTEITWLAARR